MIMIENTRYQGGDAPDGADFLVHHLAQALAVASRRIEKNSTTMSWTAPAKMTPTMIQMVLGRAPI
jgi:hypothetical protein